MIVLSLGIVAGVFGLVGLIFLGLPLLMLAAILPRLLVIAGVVLGIKALLDKPMRLESFYPVAACLVMSVVLRWLL